MLLPTDKTTIFFRLGAIAELSSHAVRLERNLVVVQPFDGHVNLEDPFSSDNADTFLSYINFLLPSPLYGARAIGAHLVPERLAHSSLASFTSLLPSSLPSRQPPLALQLPATLLAALLQSGSLSDELHDDSQNVAGSVPQRLEQRRHRLRLPSLTVLLALGGAHGAYDEVAAGNDGPAHGGGVLDLGGEALQETASPMQSRYVLVGLFDVRGDRLNGRDEVRVSVENVDRPFSRMRHVLERRAPI